MGPRKLGTPAKGVHVRRTGALHVRGTARADWLRDLPRLQRREKQQQRPRPHTQLSSLTSVAVEPRRSRSRSEKSRVVVARPSPTYLRRRRLLRGWYTHAPAVLLAIRVSVFIGARAGPCRSHSIQAGSSHHRHRCRPMPPRLVVFASHLPVPKLPVSKKHAFQFQGNQKKVPNSQPSLPPRTCSSQRAVSRSHQP